MQELLIRTTGEMPIYFFVGSKPINNSGAGFTEADLTTLGASSRIRRIDEVNNDLRGFD